VSIQLAIFNEQVMIPGAKVVTRGLFCLKTWCGLQSRDVRLTVDAKKRISLRYL